MRASHASFKGLLCALALFLLPFSAFASRIERIGLIATNAGWAMSGETLYETRDGGSYWESANLQIPNTSEYQLLDAFFTKDGLGWTLVLYASSKGDQFQVGMAHTSDFGRTWTFRRDITNGFAFLNAELSGRGRLFFLNKSIGWINLGKSGSSAANSSFVLKTTDGGQSWHSPSSTQDYVFAIGGEIGFADMLHGWIFHEEQFLETADGGATWSEHEIPLPSLLAGKGSVASLMVPQVEQNGHGSIAAIISSNDATGNDWSSILRYKTQDFGKSWKIVSSVEPSVVHPNENAYAMRGDTLYEFKVHAGQGRVVKHSTLEEKTSPAPKFARQKTHAERPEMANAQTVFLNENIGWASVYLPPHCSEKITGCVKLFATIDGGSTWKDITPAEQRVNESEGTSQGELAPTRSSPSMSATNSVVATPAPLPRSKRDRQKRFEAALLTQNSVAAKNANVSSSNTLQQTTSIALAPTAQGGLGVSRHLGFDTRRVKGIGSMSQFWSQSPYYDYNIYVNAASRGTNGDPNLNTGWVTSFKTLGFGYWITSVGRQMPTTTCMGNPTYAQFSITPATAQSQGVADAVNAVNQAVALQLNVANQTFYADIESAPGITSPACQAAAVAYLQGWYSQIHSGGYKAGVYTSLSTASILFPLAATYIDDIWITYPAVPSAQQRTVWNISTAGSTLCDPFSLTGACDQWASNQRTRQFLINITETWGNAPINLDADVEDMPAIAGTGQKAFAFTAVSYDAPGAVLTQINGIGPFLPGSGLPVVGQYQQGSATIVGAYATATQNASGSFSGFISKANPYTGTFTGFTPVSVSGSFATTLDGINSSGTGIGTYYASSTDTYGTGFYLSSKNPNSPTNIPCAGTQAANPAAINDAGQIVGTATDTAGNQHGFLYIIGGSCTLLDVNASLGTSTSITGINGQGVMVGTYVGIPRTIPGGIPNEVPFQAFYDPVAKTFAVTSYPGTSTVVSAFLDVNSNNASLESTITVTSSTPTGATYFVSDGVLQFDQSTNTPVYPLSASVNSYPLSLNDSYHEVGYYTDSSNAIHGAIWYPYSSAAPPVPTLVHVTISPVTVSVGGAGLLNYGLSINNVGANAITSAYLLISLPTGVSFQSAGSSSSCQQVGPTVECYVASLAANSSAAFTVSLAVPDPTNPPLLAISTDCDICDPTYPGASTQIGSAGGSSSADVPIPAWALGVLAIGLLGSIRANQWVGRRAS
jgi:probable HAF family extracellular repeat protein